MKAWVAKGESILDYIQGSDEGLREELWEIAEEEGLNDD